MARQLTLIAYDIASATARTRVSDMLEEVGVRVQESVFEARLTAAQREQIARRLEDHVGRGDSIRLYVLPDSAIDAIRVIGAGRPPEKGPFLLF